MHKKITQVMVIFDIHIFFLENSQLLFCGYCDSVQ